MAISVFELFTIGIGPSSSHTVGPMRAALRFANRLDQENLLHKVDSVVVQLYGSLGATGKGHGSDKAVIGGLAGHAPETANPDELVALTKTTTDSKRLLLLGSKEIQFDPQTDLEFSGVTLKFHPNGMKFSACDAAKNELAEQDLFLGRRRIRRRQKCHRPRSNRPRFDRAPLPLSFWRGTAPSMSRPWYLH